MSNTPENCEKLANYIIGEMTLDELQQFAFDDIYSLMLDDKEIYEINMEVYGAESRRRRKWNNSTNTRRKDES